MSDPTVPLAAAASPARASLPSRPRRPAASQGAGPEGCRQRRLRCRTRRHRRHRPRASRPGQGRPRARQGGRAPQTGAAKSVDRADRRWSGPARRSWQPSLAGGQVSLLSVLGVQHLRGGGGSDDCDSVARAGRRRPPAPLPRRSSRSVRQARQQHESTSKTLMTTSFAKEFEKIAPALDRDRTADARSWSRPSRARLPPLSCGDECSPSKVNVLVFLDQARLVGSSKEPTCSPTASRSRWSRRDGGWLVDDIRASVRRQTSRTSSKCDENAKCFRGKKPNRRPLRGWRLSRPALAFGVSSGLH